ncbi:hypothetical protein [Rubinisphaera brasiliensis]|uniref:Uncharacterized protein n=1 Tax=Rubinisphaera brasiliensis (strain ATCC 49424 / DSM 5305 / JCM 21570 / IAM 15109 / NBRC 103401 / IFAM 1448) TaxID=756272 RepID=F0ST96_RUBBR|nr:hypothetical protein [Rubinisphaera brasiliensis]ADY59307.1 hypothetical protein Plabr_1696 [Rubinisphaera brasiliensis DSM 5305]
MYKESHSFHSIGDIIALGREFILVWCFVYANKTQLDSPLLQRLESHDFREFLTRIIRLKIDENSWIGKDVRMPAVLPEVQCFCGGPGLCRMASMEEFDETISIAENMAGQLYPQWMAT